MMKWLDKLQEPWRMLAVIAIALPFIYGINSEDRTITLISVLGLIVIVVWRMMFVVRDLDKRDDDQNG